MPNGKIGDHPYTDITVHHRRVYSEKADALIREIAARADDRNRRALADRLFAEFNQYDNPDVGKLERILKEMRDRIVTEAKNRGFDP